jgi:hypothetical protein
MESYRQKDNSLKNSIRTFADMLGGGTCQTSTSETTNYRSTNLGVASFMICRGLKLLDTVKIAPGRCAFVFDTPQSEGDRLESEYEGGALVKARDMGSARAYLKRRVYRVLGTGASRE